MNRERSAEIEFLRGELIGPARPLDTLRPGTTVVFDGQRCFNEPAVAAGTFFWIPENALTPQEVVCYRGETPLQRYGAGLLHPRNDAQRLFGIDEGSDQLSSSSQSDSNDGYDTQPVSEGANEAETQSTEPESASAFSTGLDDDFDVTSADNFQPSVMGISFCLEDLPGQIIVALPPQKKFFWQMPDAEPVPVNGCYERCTRVVRPEGGGEHRFDAWRRVPATSLETIAVFDLEELQSGVVVSRDLNLPCGLTLQIQLFPRRMHEKWIITSVLRNLRDAGNLNTQEDRIRNVLFQTYFEVRVQGGARFSRYPEGIRPFEEFDRDEQTLALLYRDAATWAIGHGCAAAWDTTAGETPELIFADVMPAVELPSMTPDITGQNGKPITLSMRKLGELASYTEGSSTWQSLISLADEYQSWISAKERECAELEPHYYQSIAKEHITACKRCLSRIRQGISILQNDETALDAFRLANQSMLLQQIASKQLERRPLRWFDGYVAATELPVGNARTPWEIWKAGSENRNIGGWRAFQAAFLLMSISGLVDGNSEDREIVDLIWFPTGGGKTEAYLAVAAFYMFHQRLIASDDDKLQRDGTNVFMRYTLRMLTTQQFQRAASLICAMEQIRIRRHVEQHLSQLGKKPFSLGLWIGGDGSPNDWKTARSEISRFRKGDVKGSPLVLTECPWCRSEIGRIEVEQPGRRSKHKHSNNTAGLAEDNKRPYLKCSDQLCPYGSETSRLPVEVIDEAIYANPPSMFIGTADKFAMLAWKPEAGSLFGLDHNQDGAVTRVSQPPGLIIQDEFHLISGPLGTIYGLYEVMMERLCSTVHRQIVRPKIIASTATIRGAEEQVRAIYARQRLQLFPSPGLQMGDSFFGRYATSGNQPAPGRLYLGIHASGYRSFLTAQVRTFSATLFRSSLFDDKQKDPWWTLLAFYNSLRELGGARTLFTSDIAARLKDYSYRYGLTRDEQRYLNNVEELTSRRGQAELVEMMDRLSQEWTNKHSLDACLASSIIEVGVDIDRLALMAVVGQPKSTSQYIQVTGRVGRRWMERPGLILAMYNPGKSRDRSHFEQFHSYHRRLYERVEPTSATPFSVEAVERAVAGVLLVWARQRYDAKSPGDTFGAYDTYLKEARDLLLDRCDAIVQEKAESARVRTAIIRVYERLRKKWHSNPQQWWEFPQKSDGEYLMLWSGEYATGPQREKGERILSSMRNVDGNARAVICNNYFEEQVDYGQ